MQTATELAHVIMLYTVILEILMADELKLLLKKGGDILSVILKVHLAIV